METTVVVAPFALLVVVAVIVGLVMLVRALPPGSGPKVALGAGGLLVLMAMVFVGYVNVSELRPVSVAGPHSSPNFGNHPGFVSDNLPSSAMPTFSRMLLILIGLAVLVGLVMAVRSLPPGSGAKVALGVGGLLLFAMFYLWKGSVKVSHPVAVRQDLHNKRLISDDESPRNLRVAPPRIELDSAPDAGDVSVKEPEPHSLPPAASDGPSTIKPAWIAQGTQTGNGESQFPVSSELFSTVAECQRDLDSRSPALIASEVQYLVGEELPIELAPGEAQRLTAETFTEEVTTSQGTWYKVHRLIKIDPSTWAMFRTRFHQTQLQARLETIGLGFGGLMLVLGVVYLFLRRKPRVVDPTLNTFSTT